MEKTIYQVCSICLNLLDKQKKKEGRPEKLTKEEYLKEIMYVLRTGVQWRELRAPLHWTTYYKKFCKWANAGVFSNTFELINKILKKCKYLEENSYKNLYVDATMIKNVKGHDLKGVNHYDRGKNGSKISLIVTQEGIPLNMKMVASNVHDLTAFEEQIKTIKVKIIGSRIIADKGYISARVKKELEKEGINMITPHKKNQKLEKIEFERELLSGRNISENVFSWIQLRRRIRVRYEFKAKYYKEFYCLCLIEVIMKKIKL